ncbi:MAG: hypothetical protein RLZZ352_471 [Pseudomonadota bacterium]|jgi:type IV fimbrial biogenesis protein FimT
MPKASQGWTLVEAMVVVAIVAIMAAWAVPSFVGVVQQARLSATTHEFVSAIALTRSEAIKRNARVVMCVADGDAACSTTGQWHQGWLVFEDSNRNGLRDQDEVVIRWQAALSAQLVVKGNSTVSRYIAYRGDGQSHLLLGGFQAGTITICHRSSSDADGRSVILNAVGRARVSITKSTSPCTG